MQRRYALLCVLTGSTACGAEPAAAPASAQPIAPSPPSAPSKPPPPPREPPKLACEDSTSVVAAPAPEPTWSCARADGKRHGPFVTLYPDDTIEVEGRYRDGKLDGPWLRRHPGGAIAEEGAYVTGLRDGVWRQLDSRGNVLGSYKLAKGTGKQKRWLADGPLYSEITLRKGVAHGPMRILDRDGRAIVTAKLYAGKLDDKHVVGAKSSLRIEETFKRGTRRGQRQIWQFRSLLIDETYDERGRLDGTFTIWRDKKIPRVQGTYSQGKRIGTWIWTDKQNHKEREGEFIDGKKTGTWSEYLDEKLTSQGTWLDGKPDGEFVYYDRNGSELGRFTIAGGTGTMVTFHTNKKPATKTRMRNGEMHGKYEELTSRGKLIVEGHYANDKKHGTWREWTDTGVPTLESHYKRGKLDGIVKKFEAGKLAAESTYKDGKAEGPYTEYRDGKRSLAGQFVADRRDGTWSAFDAAGKPTLTATYKAGILDGTWRYVDAHGAVVEGTMAAGRRSGTWTRTERGTVTTTIVKTP